jgi:glutathione S-transferase
MSNLILYVKTGCPYCAAAIHKLEELGLSWEEKNVSDPKVVEELVARGGKKQEPYLVDKNGGIEMYESDNIVEYLEDTYGKRKEKEDAHIPTIITGKETEDKKSQAGHCEI